MPLTLGKKFIVFLKKDDANVRKKASPSQSREQMTKQEEYEQAILNFSEKWWNSFSTMEFEITDDELMKIEKAVRHALTGANNKERPTILMAQIAAEVIAKKYNCEKMMMWLISKNFDPGSNILLIGDLLDILDSQNSETTKDKSKLD